jgi:hypothetical protein
MKNQNRFFLVAAFLSAFMISCNKNESVTESSTLKQSVNQGTLDLKVAMNTIAASKAFSILTVNDGLKSFTETDSVYKVYINLDTVKGAYDYKPVEKFDRWGKSLIKFFDKTAENDAMIVRMPLAKVENPKSLRHFAPEDTLLTNNFSITVSEYHNNYNNYHDFDYILSSAISVDDVSAGNLNIKYIVSPAKGVQYASQFAFDGSYTANYKYDSGDTTVSSFSIKGDDKVLYEEKLLTIKNDSLWFGREHQYILTIGNVQIIRKSATHGVEIYLDGVLQANAVVAIIDNGEDSEVSICKKRDIQITFDDGTTTTVSALIGSSIDSIKTLFDSLHQVYFGANVVDWIAYDIYYGRN